MTARSHRGQAAPVSAAEPQSACRRHEGELIVRFALVGTAAILSGLFTRPVNTVNTTPVGP
jgi:hypothetical protein